eukprot:4613377-Amphidinium_carterae.1
MPFHLAAQRNRLCMDSNSFTLRTGPNEPHFARVLSSALRSCWESCPPPHNAKSQASLREARPGHAVREHP